MRHSSGSTVTARNTGSNPHIQGSTVPGTSTYIYWKWSRHTVHSGCKQQSLLLHHHSVEVGWCCIAMARLAATRNKDRNETEFIQHSSGALPACHMIHVPSWCPRFLHASLTCLRVSSNTVFTPGHGQSIRLASNTNCSNCDASLPSVTR